MLDCYLKAKIQLIVILHLCKFFTLAMISLIAGIITYNLILTIKTNLQLGLTR